MEANVEVQSQAAREAADAQAQAVWDNLQPATRNDDLDRADPAGVAVADSAPGTSPILDRLRSFGQTRGLVFGAYGEASPDVHALLTVAADGLAARQWGDMGARTQEEARSFIVSSLRRRLGLVICREFARHRIRRVPYIGVPRAVVEQRMQRGQLIGGPQARVPLYVPYADFYQYQAGAGRLADRA